MSEQHIHIHIGGDDSKSSSPMKETSANKVGVWYDKLLGRVKQCYDWKSLHELRSDFGSIGLAMRETAGNRNILCRVESGKPATKHIIDDYIFVGSAATMDEEIGKRALEVILHFIEENAGQPQALVNDDQGYSQDIALYGKPVRVQEPTPTPTTLNVPNVHSQQEIEIMSRLIETDEVPSDSYHRHGYTYY